MIIFVWTRRLYRTLSADASPSAIAFGILFGLTLGCVPLRSGLAWVLIACTLVLRVQLSATFLALALTKLLYAAGLWQLFLPAGDALLEAESLRPFWSWFLNLPGIAWLDLDRVAVTGGAAVGLALGTILFLPCRSIVIAYRKFLHEGLAGNRYFQWMTSWWFAKVLRFVFVGTKP